MSASERVVLPQNAKPFHYQLDLYPDLERLEYFADEEIHVKVLSETTEIVLHSKV